MKQINQLFPWLLFTILFVNTNTTFGQIFESFETGLPTSYTTTNSFILESGTWTGQENGIIRSTEGVNSGSYSLQLRRQTGAQITSPTINGGISTISFYVTASTTTSGAYQVNISTNNGLNWSAAPGSPFTISTTKTLNTITINNSDVNKIQIYRTGATIYIDDVLINTLNVINPEPTTHATNIEAVENGSTSIIVGWTDVEVADGYLIKASTIGHEEISAPADGTPESDATLVKNVAQNEEIVEFTGLAAGTTYYFKIWPYSNSSSNINYKTDGTVPQTNTSTAIPLSAPTATTATGISSNGFTANWNAVSGATEYEINVYIKEPAVASNLFISEYGEGSTGDKKYVEIFNGTGNAIDLANYKIRRSANGGGWNATSYSFPVSTTLANNSTFVLAHNPDDVLYAHDYQSFCQWNGNDAIGLFKNDLLIDVLGTPNTDPGNGWTVAAIGVATKDHILVRKSTVTTPNTDWTSSAGTSTENSEWFVSESIYSATDQTSNLGSHSFSGGTSSTPISGSPFSATGSTSQVITGLNPDTEYTYTVVAKNTNESSEVSNEISIVTDIAIETEVNASEISDGIERKLVINQGGHLTLNANKSFHSVTLKPRAKLTLNNGQTFAPGTFVLESDASGTATFVDKRSNANKTNITATVKRHLPAATDRTWWYLASPVDGASYTVFGSNKVGDYSETTRSYSNPFAAPTTLTAGKGYVVKMTAAEATDYIFADNVLNTGDISVALTRTISENPVNPDNAKRGFNLVGNPYPSYIDWNYVYLEAINLRPTIWYRTLDGTSMEFHTYNAELGVGSPTTVSEYIPPMQAFWVKVDTDPVSPATVSNGTLNFTNDMRSHDESVDGNPLKTPAADRNIVRLSISNGTLSDETVIVTHPSASDNYDSYDSEKMANGDTNRPEIFSMAGSQELVINGISPLTDSKQIALGIRPGRAGNYTISLTEWRNTGNLEAVLRDNQLGEELILTESNNYSFDTDGSTSTSRFSLLFRAKGSKTGFDHISSDLMIYASQKSIRVESASLEGNAISIFNALGQPVFNGKAQSNRLEINGLTPAVYMVKVNNQTKMVVVK